jgi:hypothetical protein
LPLTLYTVLDAPSLRDDYYCSLLAYSYTAKVLAVGLGSHVYLWSETRGVDTPDSLNAPYVAHVTALAFSSTAGEGAILCVGRACGRILLWSPFDEEPRFDAVQPSSVCCVSFRPTPLQGQSKRDPYRTVNIEHLIVGDEVGHLYFYAVEWPNAVERDLFGWSGSFTLTARITAHTQQICGLAWGPDGEFFASGGNDNQAHLFETKRVLNAARSNARAVSNSSTTAKIGRSSEETQTNSNNNASLRSRTPSTASTLWLPSPANTINARRQTVSLNSSSYTLPSSISTHTFNLHAAIKALAFCPWQRGLLALGGGSNDRQIHFQHTLTGAKLAAIDCSAQVTSLVWSTTRREIAATFGFSVGRPTVVGTDRDRTEGHAIRVAVFSWPRCECVVRIEWADECRALYAIAYPGGPNGLVGSKMNSGGKSKGRGGSNGEGGTWYSRTEEEGCLVVATSDASIKFHEVWAEERRATVSKGGLLGGSDILESLHGIEKEDLRVIR